MAHLKCLECGRFFKYHHQLRKHRRGHSMMNRTTYRCKICNMVFTYLFKLREHLGRHFNCKSGENMYIDDLAIGVTIEPVQTGYDWSTSQCTSLASVGEARETPDGGPCHCVEGEKCMTVCNQQQTCRCPGCPRHVRPCLSCPYHLYPSCCSSFPPQAGRMFPRYSSTRLVNPQLVLHVDTTQDSRLSIPPSQHCALQDNPCHCQLSAAEERSCSGSVDCSDSRCCISSDVTDKDDDCNNLALADSDSAVQQPLDLIHADPRPKTGRQLENVPDSVTEDKVSTCSKTSQTEGEESTSKPHRAERGMDWGAYSEVDGSSRSDAERSDDSQINLKMPTHSTDDQAENSMEGMEDFDDMATLNDLSNFFPDLNDNPSDQPGQVTSESMLDASLSNNIIIGIEDGPSTDLHDEVECVSETKHCRPGVSDIEACVKNGLDSTAINPTVVVNDLQSLCRGRQMKQKNIFKCEICQVTYDTRIALANHKRSKKHVQTKTTIQDKDVTSNQKRRRSDRNLHKNSLGITENKSVPYEEAQDTNISDKKKPVALKRKCEKVSGSAGHPKTYTLSDELMSKIGRSGLKNGSYRRNSCGPQLKATVTKLNIQCYICGRVFTTKQHFIIHAKEHLRKLGYSDKKDDLFYCTICYAFYPCENDLREHLIDKHVDDNLSAVHTSQPPNPGGHLQQGGSPKASTSADGEQDAAKLRTYCRGEGNVRRWNDTDVRPRLISGSDSDIAESTTDQLVFEEMDSPGDQMNQEGEAEEFQDGCMCHVCGETCASVSNLGKHLKTHDILRPKVAESGDTYQQVGWQHSENRRATARSGLKYRRHTCSLCKRVLPSYYALRSHMQVHDPDRKRLRCPLCQGECVWKQNFKSHLLRHATPAGQNFNTVHFAPHSKILCPFCSEVSLYETVDKYKKHMLEHINKIMSEECGRTTLPRYIGFATRKEDGTVQPVKNLLSKTYKRKSQDLPRFDNDTHVTPDEKGPVSVSLLSTSTPNTHCYQPDITADMDSMDGSPEGSLQGNSGLFMSPEWGRNSSNMGSYGTQSGNPGSYGTQSGNQGNYGAQSGNQGNYGTQSGNPAGSAYTQLTSQGSVTAKFLTRPGLNHRSYQIEPDLNDSDCIQTFSGESDLFTQTTPLQKLPSFPTFSSKLDTLQPTSTQSSSRGPSAAPRPHSVPRAMLNTPSAQQYSPTRPHSVPRAMLNTPSAQQYSPTRPHSVPRAMLNTPSAQQYSRYSGSSIASRPVHSPASTSQGTHSIERSQSREFLSLERVSELMKTTSRLTKAFYCEGQPCSICGAVVLTSHNIKEHLFSHFDCNGRFAFIKRDRKHECPICFKMVGERRSATAHLFTHWGTNILRCPVCNKPFNFLKTLKVHAQKFHPHFKFSLTLFDSI